LACATPPYYPIIMVVYHLSLIRDHYKLSRSFTNFCFHQKKSKLPTRTTTTTIPTQVHPYDDDYQDESCMNDFIDFIIHHTGPEDNHEYTTNTPTTPTRTQIAEPPAFNTPITPINP
jgi:hypothetical protein